MPSAPYRLVNRDIYLCIGSSLYFFRNQSSKGDGLHRRRRGGQGGSSLYIYIDSFIYLFIYLFTFRGAGFSSPPGRKTYFTSFGIESSTGGVAAAMYQQICFGARCAPVQSSQSPALPLGRFLVAVCVMSFVVMHWVRIAWKRLSKSTMRAA